MFHKKNVIPVVTASDENYAPYLSVMLSSLLDHVSEEVSLNIYVIDDEISDVTFVFNWRQFSYLNGVDTTHSYNSFKKTIHESVFFKPMIAQWNHVC